MRVTRRYDRGMTLMEMIIVTAVVALVMTGMAMGIGTLTRQRLVSSSIQLAALVRTAYSRAATTGRTVRIVFDLDGGANWLEEAEGGAVLLTAEDAEEQDEEEQQGSSSGSGARAQADLLGAALGTDATQLLSAARGAAETDLTSSMDFEALGLLGASGMEAASQLETPRYRVPRFSRPEEGRLSRNVQLPTGVSLAQVATEHRDGPALEGRAYLYFFPGGLTELAVIQLRDGRGYVNSVEVRPLTGRCTIHDVPFELPTRDEDLDEAREAS